MDSTLTRLSPRFFHKGGDSCGVLCLRARSFRQLNSREPIVIYQLNVFVFCFLAKRKKKRHGSDQSTIVVCVAKSAIVCDRLLDVI